MRMKDRLTLTIDPIIARKAKLAAKRRNRSLSSLVEGLLSGEIGEVSEVQESSSFSQRWKGKLSLQRRSDERFERLSKKYDLG